jgi:hypothetical protein
MMSRASNNVTVRISELQRRIYRLRAVSCKSVSRKVELEPLNTETRDLTVGIRYQATTSGKT